MTGAAASISAVVIGRLSDRWGHKRVLIVGLLVTGLMTSLGMTLGPLAGGIMGSHMGFRWPFVIVSLLPYAICDPPDPEPEEVNLSPAGRQTQKDLEADKLPNRSTRARDVHTALPDHEGFR